MQISQRSNGARRLGLSRRAVGDFGHQIAEHGDVVAGPERGGADEASALDFVEGVFEFTDAVAG
jgi:hypothetical protein